MNNKEILENIMNVNKDMFSEIDGIHEFRWGRKVVTLGKLTIDSEDMELMMMIETSDSNHTFLRAYLDKKGEATLTLISEYKIHDEYDFKKNNGVVAPEELKKMIDVMIANYKAEQIRKVEQAIAQMKHVNRSRLGVEMAPMFV